MQRDNVIATLKAHEAELKRPGVRHLYLSGSTGRDESPDDSAVDPFFDYEAGSLSLFDLMDMKERAARLTDMVEAIDLIRAEGAGVTLDTFQPDSASAG